MYIVCTKSCKQRCLSKSNNPPFSLPSAVHGERLPAPPPRPPLLPPRGARGWAGGGPQSMASALPQVHHQPPYAGDHLRGPHGRHDNDTHLRGIALRWWGGGGAREAQLRGAGEGGGGAEGGVVGAGGRGELIQEIVYVISEVYMLFMVLLGANFH